MTSITGVPSSTSIASRRSRPLAAILAEDGLANGEIDPLYRPGLEGLEGFSDVAVLTWLDRSPRDLIVQKPRHAAQARGVFALRSPARPNPVGLHVVRLLAVDAASGLLRLEAIDVLDGTPVIDVKPYYAATDAIPDATRPDRA